MNIIELYNAEVERLQNRAFVALKDIAHVVINNEVKYELFTGKAKANELPSKFILCLIETVYGENIHEDVYVPFYVDKEAYNANFLTKEEVVKVIRSFVIRRSIFECIECTQFVNKFKLADGNVIETPFRIKYIQKENQDMNPALNED